MQTTKTALMQLAESISREFETATRPDGSMFVRRKGDYSLTDWIHDMCYAAHDNGNISPDDFIYRAIVESLDALAETEDADDINLEPDIYTAELMEWAGSQCRWEMVDEAYADYGWPKQGGVEALVGIAQATFKAEILGVVRSALESRIGTLIQEQGDTIVMDGSDFPESLSAVLADQEMDYRNQREDYCDSLAGVWFAVPDEPVEHAGGCFRVIFSGSFGNDHSPGSSGSTFARLYNVLSSDAMEEFANDLAEWEGFPEYLETESDDSDDDSNPE